ncbi:hypothetical protein KFL_015300020 [Klebsormidium nitens]|uniref:HTH psq-type domain-containing protein n=1 Tax=Klebsormidium nitens TaxID=105231 RepID=A0A1Y1IYM9_KLENI|nr:hypothetical protein KFL_015300020 [Klebsormidium nitens]|eukprot:GAQ93438.1 hypothetical protein KFL_015300020 [Klebsormidium nitens]
MERVRDVRFKSLQHSVIECLVDGKTATQAAGDNERANRLRFSGSLHAPDQGGEESAAAKVKMVVGSGPRTERGWREGMGLATEWRHSGVSGEEKKKRGPRAAVHIKRGNGTMRMQKEKNWAMEDMEKAVPEAGSKIKSLQRAAKDNNVPFSTLRRRLERMRGGEAGEVKKGGRTVLPKHV